MDTEENEDLPATQMLDDRVLKNVVAYVEVRSTNDNRSPAICRELELLGAKVVKKFTDEVTHVIFKEGSKRTRTKAQKKKIHLVSVLWVDSCKQNQQHVSERLYPAIVPHSSKGTPLLISKLKKAKSMQPRDFEEDVASSAERCNKRRKRINQAALDRIRSTDNTPCTSPRTILVLDTQAQPRSPFTYEEGFCSSPVRLTIPDTPASMREKLVQLKMAKMAAGSYTSTSGVDDGIQSGAPAMETLQKKLFPSTDHSFSSESDNESLSKEISSVINSVFLSTEDSSECEDEDSPQRDRNHVSKKSTKTINKSKRKSKAAKSANLKSTADISSNEDPIPRVEDVSPDKFEVKKLVRKDSLESNTSVVQDTSCVGGNTKMKKSKRESKETEYRKFERDSVSEKEKTDKNKEKQNRRRKSVTWKNKDTVIENDDEKESSKVFENTTSTQARFDQFTSREKTPVRKSSRRASVAGFVVRGVDCQVESEEVIDGNIGGRSEKSTEDVGKTTSRSVNGSDLEDNIKEKLPTVTSEDTSETVDNEDRNDAVRCRSSINSGEIERSPKGRNKSPRSRKRTKSGEEEMNKLKKCLVVDSTDTVELESGAEKNKKKPTLKKKLLSLTDLSDPPDELVEPSKYTEQERPVLVEERVKKVPGKRQKLGKERKADELQKLTFEPSVDSDSIKDVAVPKTQKGRKRKLKSIDEIEDTKLEKKRRAGSATASNSGLYNTDTETQRAEMNNTNNLACSNINITLDHDRPLSSQQSSLLNNTGETTLGLTLRDTTLGMSMSLAYNDSRMASMLMPPRPSIDEFNFTENRPRKRKTKAAKGGKENKVSNSQRGSPEVDRSLSGNSDSETGKSKKTQETGRHRKYSRPSLVMTSLHSYEQDVVISVVKQLGGFVLTDQVCESTTHIVCGENRRTLNVLRGLARGLWLLRKDWALKSLEAGHWLPEESYECHEEFPACRVSREERENCEGPYKQDLFSPVGQVYVSQKCKPPRKDLVHLVKLCGGEVTGSLSSAQIYIGTDLHPDIVSLKPLWILDCITEHRILPMELYTLDRPKRESSPVY